MAAPLSNNFSLCSPRLTASILKPYKSPEFKIIPHQSQQHHHPRLFNKPFFGLSPLSNCRSFKSVFTAKDSTLETSDDDEALPNDLEVSEGDADQKISSGLKSLLQIYKEAVLDGDDKITSDIEATISLVEIEKNELAEKVATLSSEINSGKEKYIRLQADFDNFRKRSEKERLTVRSNAQGEVIENLLPMIDNFERAKQQLKIETEKEKQIDASYQGIYKQFVEIMRSLRVAVVPTVGKPFDPLVHEAIAREESPEFNEGIIVQEFRRGFLLGDRLLRPAMVKVSAGPGQLKPKPSAQESTDFSTQESSESSIPDSTNYSTHQSTEQPQTAG